jgi:hypothetical protein
VPYFILRYAVRVPDNNEPSIPDHTDRGILLAIFVLDASGTILNQLDEKRRGICAAAWQDLLNLSEAERAEIMGRWREEAVNPLPAGLESLHPSWIAEAVAGEPDPILRIIRVGLPECLRPMIDVVKNVTDQDKVERDVGEDVPVEKRRALMRIAFGWLGPLCENTYGPLAEQLCSLEFEALLSEVTRLGARTVGLSLVGASPLLRARAMAAAGEPWSKIIGEASMESPSESERRKATLLTNTSVVGWESGRLRRSRSIAGGHGNPFKVPLSATWVHNTHERLLCIGLAVLATELAAEDSGSVFRVAGRLPATIGRTMIGW